ncbi:MAG: [protein-PII] uridylyltransferase [Methylovulum sp.]|nr:[protein-PII] uridylyltransferase [Methylovulum sp.]
MQRSDTAIFNTQDALPYYKKVIKAKNEVLREAFNPHQSVASLLKERSDFIDSILTQCWQHFIGHYANQLSLVAVGGYGRQELFPFSDIDIVVLLDSDDTSAYQEALASFFTFLWDIGLKPGQSVRTLDECYDTALSDQTIMTSLMEIRLITGCPNQFNELQLRISPDKIWSSSAFFLAKMHEQQLRHAKAHDTAYNLEPNIKEGPGGLRDMQVVAWVFQRHYHTASLDELVKYSFLPASEYAELIAAREVLWRIRYALHLLTNRGEDRLIFDYQRDIAFQFGFNKQDQQYNEDVEQFMQFYFKTVQGLERLNEMLLQLFNERFVGTTTNVQPITISKYFVAINGYLEAINDDIFKTDPLALLDIFIILEKNPSLKGIRATTIRLIRKNLYLINDDFRTNKQANALFIELLRQPFGITTQLKRMNRYGVLAAYLPSFAHIVARMQYDLFHVYTVDEHTLFVIRNLRRFAFKEHYHELPFCHSLFRLIPKPELLYIAALFHDIAKGCKGDHSTIGEDIARQFCAQHELSTHDTKLVTWLVRNHLIMSMTAQRKDIADADIIHEFAQHVASIEYLNYLYLLTVADIRATNPELWNSWKDALLKELYSATHSALHKGLKNPTALTDRLLENKKDAKDELLKLVIDETRIEQLWQHASNDYFLRYSTEEIAWHTQAIITAPPETLPLVLLRPQTQRGSAEIFVYSENTGPIFSLSTATLDQLGLTILEARINTTTDNHILNSFQILEQSGAPIADQCREQHICSALRHNLCQQEIKKQRNIHRQSRQAKHFPIPTTINFQTDTSNRHTIIELITTDHAGLLSKISTAFILQNIKLHSAKITTIGSRAEDIFYVTNAENELISDLNKQHQIEIEMLKALDNEE